MSSHIKWTDQFVAVSNRQLSGLVGLVLQVAAEYADSASELNYVSRLRHWVENDAWPGILFDIDERFPSLEEKKFWGRCFSDLGRRIFRREIGETAGGETHWQSSMIGDSYIVARMLTRAVQESQLAWHPDTADDKEAAEVFARIRTTF